MSRFLPYILAGLSFCSNGSQSLNYFARTSYRSLDGKFTSNSENTWSQSEGLISIHSMNRRNNDEPKVSDLKTVINGRTKIRYENGVQTAVITKDDQANCETERSFSIERISEHTTCAGFEVSRIVILPDHTYEKKCTREGKMYTCLIKRNDQKERIEYHFEDGNTRIFAFKLLPEDTTMQYSMWQTHDIVNGEQTNGYDLELPDGAPFPSIQHPGWELSATHIKTGYIPSIQKYALEIDSQRYHSVKRTIEMN